MPVDQTKSMVLHLQLYIFQTTECHLRLGCGQRLMFGFLVFFGDASTCILYATNSFWRRGFTSQSRTTSWEMLSFIWWKFRVCSCASDRKPHFCSIVLISSLGIFSTVLRMYSATVSSMMEPPGKLKGIKKIRPSHSQAQETYSLRRCTKLTSAQLADIDVSPKCSTTTDLDSGKLKYVQQLT